MKIYNTLTKKKEILKPLKPKKVLIYTCGPTVYDYDHLGHAWNYSQADFLRRTLEYNGYKVKQAMNITDVGHLTSDADTGEDKMEKSAKEKNKSVWEIADYFTKIYLENREKLNLEEPEILCKATDNIQEMIALIKTLIKKGYAYKTNDGIYFSIENFPAYGKLSGNTIKNLKAGARIEINQEKRHPADFALWKLSPTGTKRQMEWDSPWGKGFPGWHIECSAMAIKYLGKTIDIHTGGEIGRAHV
jgi:cysteinyl-tRNA synthetase